MTRGILFRECYDVENEAPCNIGNEVILFYLEYFYTQLLLESKKNIKLKL